MFDVCVIGHVTRDLIAIEGSARQEQPGGAATYTGIALASLGLRTAVITKVAREDERLLLGGLEDRGVAVFRSPSKRTMAFENIYPGESLDLRSQKVSAIASPFGGRDLGTVRAALFHLGTSTSGDISVRFLREVSERGGRVSLDVQGMLRKIERGAVRLADWREKEMGLSYVDILKADEDEARILSGEDEVARAARRLARFGPTEVIVTMGSRGSIVFCDDRLYQIPAYPPREAVDATGCGDSYVAGYIYRRLRSDDIMAAGRFAAALATCKLERSGPFIGGERDVAALTRARTW